MIMAKVIVYLLLTSCLCVPGKAQTTLDASEQQWIAKIKNKPLPNFSLKDLDGIPVTNDQLKGDVVIFNFWSVSCSNCVKEIPELNRLKEKYDGKGVKFVAVCTETVAAVKKLMKKKQFDYRLIANGGSLDSALDVPVYPTHVIVDETGTIKDVLIGGNEVLDQLDASIGQASRKE